MLWWNNAIGIKLQFILLFMRWSPCSFVLSEHSELFIFSEGLNQAFTPNKNFCFRQLLSLSCSLLHKHTRTDTHAHTHTHTHTHTQNKQTHTQHTLSHTHSFSLSTFSISLSSLHSTPSHRKDLFLFYHPHFIAPTHAPLHTRTPTLSYVGTHTHTHRHTHTLTHTNFNSKSAQIFFPFPI